LTDDRKTPDEPFLQRWARRKADVATADAGPKDQGEAPGVETASPDGAAPAPVNSDTETGEPEVDLAALPDIDSLDARSDFSVFMQNGIPEELRTRALQRLWRLDPSFGHVDGLLEYGEDFTGTGLAADVVNTAYKVGKGMLSDEEDAPPPDDSGTAEEASGDTVAAAAAPLPETEPPGDESPNDDNGPEKTG
jgi:hypothetical protein